MRTSSFMRNRPSVSLRLLGGIGLLVFLGAYFVMPLSAAIAMCTMPCCAHGGENGGTTLTSADMMSCETECALRSDEATSTAAPVVAPQTGAARGVLAATVIAVAEHSATAAGTEHHTTGFVRGFDAPLHVLNSTFRI